MVTTTTTRTKRGAEQGEALSTGVEQITISPPRIREAQFRIEGEAPYMMARFSEKALRQIRETQAAGSTARKGKAREPRDFDADFIGALHKSTEGWIGIPAAAFRNASIDACRMAGFAMTRAKMSIFIVPDGFDAVDGTPLVKILDVSDLEGTKAQPEPEHTEMAVRNASGVVDIRVRPIWRKWAVNLRVRFDSDQFTISDVSNLLARAGQQVGIGEGRPFSKDSAGLGFGLFGIG